jgi:hypothetical protein
VPDRRAAEERVSDSLLLFRRQAAHVAPPVGTKARTVTTTVTRRRRTGGKRVWELLLLLIAPAPTKRRPAGTGRHNGQSVVVASNRPVVACCEPLTYFGNAIHSGATDRTQGAVPSALERAGRAGMSMMMPGQRTGPVVPPLAFRSAVAPLLRFVLRSVPQQAHAQQSNDRFAKRVGRQ